MAFDLFGVHAVHVERRIRHHKITLADELLGLIVKSVALTDVGGIQAVHHQVHTRQFGVGVALFLTVKSHHVVGLLLAHGFNKVACLHEHTCRATRRVQDLTVIWLDHIDNHAHQRGRRKKFAAFLRATHREFVEEVFVDAPENIPSGGLDRRAVKDFNELGQQVRFKRGVATR